MTRTATCTCGYEITYHDDEEYYGLVRRHILPLDRDKHHLLRSRVTRPEDVRSRSRPNRATLLRRPARTAR